MNDREIQRMIHNKYMQENLAAFMECIRQLSRVPTNEEEVADIEGGFMMELQRRKIESAPSEAIRNLRIAAWRARELHENELGDRQGYLERATKCQRQQRHLEVSDSAHCRDMAVLCADEGRECEVRAALSQELAARALDRGYMLERIQMNHEFWDYKKAQSHDAAREADSGSRDEQEQLRHRAEEDLKVRFDRELAGEAEDVARASRADRELEERCAARDETRKELVRLWNLEKEAREAGLV